MKKYKSGLVLGKYMPLHMGHMHLIDSAAHGSQKLTVLVCSLTREPIPGDLRYNWVQKHCNDSPEIKVVHITDDTLPQEPSEHENFWNIWCDLIKTNCPDIDVIYSSEEYGFELAKRLNITHELVDKERVQFPISGTAIRNNPYENWKYIFWSARQYFMNRVYFLGPESTGKTTITELMAKKYETNSVPEYGRILSERKFGNIELMDFYEIVIKQREIENNLSEKSDSQFIFCDTETITTKVFCKLYYPGEYHKLEEFFNYHIEKQFKNSHFHFFVMHPEGIEAIQDGTRNFISDEQRLNHFNLIIEELNIWGIPHVVLKGTHEERIAFVSQYVEEKFKIKEVIEQH